MHEWYSECSAACCIGAAAAATLGQFSITAQLP